MNWNYFSRYLQQKEHDKADQIAGISYLNFNAWQIIKTPFYFNRILAVNHKHDRRPALYRLKFFLRSIVDLACYAWFSVRYGLLRKASGKCPVLIFAFSGDKLARDEKGNYFNYLVDAFVTEGVVKDYLYVEQSFNGNFKTPSPVKTDIRADFFLRAIAGYKLWHGGGAAVGNTVSRLMNVLEIDGHDKEWNTEQVRSIIKDTLTNFRAEYQVWKAFLKRVRPDLIICSEKPGTGFLAAARTLQIQSIDLQHGIIDPFHPQYVYSRRLLHCKEHLVLPTWIGVFGSFHKNILMQSGFWDESEIIVLGSYRMENNRKQLEVARSDDQRLFSILLPTQWTVCDAMISLLSFLGKRLHGQVQIIVKLHPMEYPNNIIRYQRLADSFPSVKIKGKDTDVYSLIKSCGLMVGFDSAVLLESISLGTPAITIGTEETPHGIHSVFENDYLETAIRSVKKDEQEKLVWLIKNAIEDKAFYESWKMNAIEKGEELYAKGYIANCRKFIHENCIKQETAPLERA